VVPRALAAAGVEPRQLAVVGLTNQRETIVLWERGTGRPVGRAIVWQDRRTADFCRQHKGDEPWIYERTGLVLDPYFSATKVRWLLDQDPRHRAEAEAHVGALYPRLLASHRWWKRARDPGDTGLVASLHPWETGMDNSPAWDAPLARVPTETATAVVRRDTMHVDAAMRPREEEYLRFIHLVDLFRETEWEPARMMAASPFRVIDVGTNAILLRAERDLLALAGRFGTGGRSRRDCRAHRAHEPRARSAADLT